MDANLLGVLLAVLVAVISFGRWLVKLEGRQTTHEAVCAERQSRIAEALARIQTTQASEHSENKQTLRRLEDKLESLTGEA